MTDLCIFVRFESEEDGEVVREVFAKDLVVGKKEVGASFYPPGPGTVMHTLEGASVWLEVTTVLYCYCIYCPCKQGRRLIKSLSNNHKYLQYQYQMLTFSINITLSN